jgi:hypothetical protein
VFNYKFIYLIIIENTMGMPHLKVRGGHRTSADWRIKAGSREKWQKLIVEGKSHPRLCSLLNYFSLLYSFSTLLFHTTV